MFYKLIKYNKAINIVLKNDETVVYLKIVDFFVFLCYFCLGLIKLN